MPLLISALKAAGLTDAQIVAAIDSEQREKQARQREYARQRQREYRARKAEQNQASCHAVTHNMRDNKERSPTPPKEIIPSESSKEDSSGISAACQPLQKIEENQQTRKGTRLPPDFELPDTWQAWAADRGLSNEEISSEFAKLKDWALSRAGPASVKRDWAAAWRNWLRAWAERKGRTLSVLPAAPAAQTNGKKPLTGYAAHWAHIVEQQRKQWA
jgi:hypothetical protein